MNLSVKYFAKDFTHDAIDLYKMYEINFYQYTVSESDILAALNSLYKKIMQQIKKGNLVQLGRVGSFQLSLNSARSDSAEEVTAENVLRKRILFRPSPRMKKELKTLSFRKVS